MVCTSCGRPLSFLRRGTAIGDDVLCPECFAEVPPPGEMERLARFYAEQSDDNLLSVLKKGKNRYRVYSLKVARDELVERGGSAADRARVLFSAVENAEQLEKLIDRLGDSESVAGGAPSTGAETERNTQRLRTSPAEAFLTTESALNLPVSDRLGIVSAESAINMRGLRDFLVGTLKAGEARSLRGMSDLQQAKRAALEALRAQAAELDADAVVGVTLRLEQLGAGINMLLVSATGTAVRLTDTQPGPDRDPDSDTTRDPFMVPIYRFDPTRDDD